MAHNDISLRNMLNELTGAEWLYFTKSILTTAYPSEYGHHLRKEHGANKPPQLMRQLIEFFTKPGGRVLDPFAGVGGTLIGAAICKKPREAVGIEINQRWVDIYTRVIAEENARSSANRSINPYWNNQCCTAIVCTSCPKSTSDSFDFIATDPPYNIHLLPTMSLPRYAKTYTNRHTNYDMHSDHPADLANLPDLQHLSGCYGAGLCFLLSAPQAPEIYGYHCSQRLSAWRIYIHPC